VAITRPSGDMAVVKNIHFDATRGVNWPDG